MREKKIRGMKRKTKNMIKRIEEHTMKFPSEFKHHYWHMHLPIAQDFIDSKKTPNKVKRLCMQTLLERAYLLMQMKPNDRKNYRVVVAISLPELWSSQIIIFKGESYFLNFFNRNNDYQKWLQLSDGRDIQKEWGLLVPNDMQISGYKELMIEEDGYRYEGEIWFIGELK